MAELRIASTPNRRAGFHDRWHPLLSDVSVDRAVVGAERVYTCPGVYRCTVELYRRQEGTFGWPARRAGVGTTVLAHIGGLSVSDATRHGDSVEMLCPTARPVWECKKCGSTHTELASAGRCAAACTEAIWAALVESVERFYAANVGAWWLRRH